MRDAALARCAGGVVGLLAALLAFAPVAAAGSATVEIAGMSYEPQSTTVAVGDTVTWSNGSFLVHTVTAVNGLFDSERIPDRSSFSYTFQQAGTYAYYCTVHPGMRGDVVVKPAGSGPSASAPGVPVPASAMHVVLSGARGNGGPGRILVHVRAPRPGAAVLLELYSLEHFSWRQVAHALLDGHGRLTFGLHAHLHRRLRVVIPSEGGQPTLISRTLAV